MNNQEQVPFFRLSKNSIYSLAIVLNILMVSQLWAQDKSPVVYGKVTPADFTIPSVGVVDSGTTAVIISDIGNISFIGNKTGWVSYVFKRQTRIKILNKSGLEAATVKVLLYQNEDSKEKMDNLTGASYNLVNGTVTSTSLDKKDVYEEKTNKRFIEKKFAIPGAKEGSIIEYSYTITSDFYYNLPEWEFQSINYPTLWSEYNVSIPSLVGYVSLRQGIHPYAIDKASEGYQNFIVQTRPDNGLVSQEGQRLSVSSPLIKHRWVMKDLPVCKAENYMTTPYNYIDKIQFQLAQTYDGEQTHAVTNNWRKATQELLSQVDFGLPLKENIDDYEKVVSNILENETNALEKAKKIFYYVQSNVRCNNHYNKYIETNLRDVLKKGSGGVGEINLLLASMLRAAGMHADPVLLSTREAGFNSPNYPLLQKLNYVVCRVLVNGTIYYLDASVPILGFGKLPENCYNGHARIICQTDSSSVYFTADSIREPQFTSVFIQNDDKNPGTISGRLQYMPGYFESTDIREQINSHGEKSYFSHLQDMSGSEYKLENFEIDSLKTFDIPLKLKYDFTIKHDGGEDLIYFNPMMGDGLRQNPFKAAQRFYPIEMPYPMDHIYILNMEIPTGYVVDELPKSIKMLYNGNEGYFEYLVQANQDGIQLRSHIKLNKANFSADDYDSLRDFFANIVKKHGEQIVFKKKK